jgi:hypothetical protein
MTVQIRGLADGQYFVTVRGDEVTVQRIKLEHAEPTMEPILPDTPLPDDVALAWAFANGWVSLDDEEEGEDQ